ncbi:solute carrier family 10 member 6-like [Limulus polyphemus]|uniref:Solute carrier family 10 member 6-like n=1 Tax=Limulus polyphemus TaxID=6850 RepID=A0ABM1B451_LIMPO|nr:solute carrier family 10 member 6-like [Limulus polyphemus]
MVSFHRLKEWIWSHLKKPIGLAIGMASQFFLIPLLAFSFVKICEIHALYATGMMIVSCCSGGSSSNMITYFCEGDVSLSVAMTTCSTIIALGMMPFNLWIYSHGIDTGAVTIPYWKMAVSLIIILLPLAFGMILKVKLPKVAPIFTKLGSYSGYGIILIIQVMELFIFPDIFDDAPFTLYIAALVMPSGGIILGIVCGRIFRQSWTICRTIGIEAGFQNVGTALTVISLSFPFKIQREVILFPALYGFSMMCAGFLMAILFQIYKRFSRRKSENVTDGALKEALHLEITEKTENDIEDSNAESKMLQELKQTSTVKN